jgi:hypothetical protein
MITYVQELLEKVEENSSGEEQWDINFRYLYQCTYQCSGSGSTCFWASRIHYSEVWIRIRLWIRIRILLSSCKK